MPSDGSGGGPGIWDESGGGGGGGLSFGQLLSMLVPAVMGAIQIAFRPSIPNIGFQGPPAPPVQTLGQRNAITASIGQQLPTLQSQVGGSVSPEYYAKMAELLSGNANTPGAAGAGQTAVNQFFGIGGPGVTSSAFGETSGTGTPGVTSASLTSPSRTSPSGTPSPSSPMSTNMVQDMIRKLMEQLGGGGNSFGSLGTQGA